MADEDGLTSKVEAQRSSLPPPMPKSPPMYPDLYGKRREAARLQMLDKEIAILQEALDFVEALQPASVYCKEVVEFVVAAADPLTPTNKKKDHKSYRAWKWLRKLPCFNLSWLCCYNCSPSIQVPKCCRSCKPCDCTAPECNIDCLRCFQKSSSKCCHFSRLSSSTCFHSLCTKCSCLIPKCAPCIGWFNC